MSKHLLHDYFTAIIERDRKWYVGHCPEIPGANGQGESLEECKKNLAEAIALILQEGGSHSLWINPRTSAIEVVPRHTETAN